MPIRKRFVTVLVVGGVAIIVCAAELENTSDRPTPPVEIVRREAVEALARRFPAVECCVSTSRRAGGCLYVFVECVDPLAQIEMREWLVEWKKAKQLETPIHLQFFGQEPRQRLCTSDL